MKRRSGPDAGWNVDGLVEVNGTSLFDHATKRLGDSGWGPVQNGGEPLPDDAPREKGKIRFVAGGHDAVLAQPDSPQATLSAAAALLDLLAHSPSPGALQTVYDRLADVRGPAEIDRLVLAVGVGRPPRERLANFSRWLCRTGTTREVVKAGIALLGISGDAEDRDLVIRLGLLEELTLYSLVALQNLSPEPEEAIFALAQQVEGWGRVEAVRRLEGAQSAEVKRWLLYGGYVNRIMDEYTAFIAATTGGLRRALESGDVDDELLDHAGAILNALAMGGPAEDLSDYEEAQPALAAYLRRMVDATPTLRRVRDIVGLRIGLDIEDDEENPHLPPDAANAIIAAIDELTSQTAWRAPILEALESDALKSVKGVIGSARNLSIDVGPVLWKWIERAPTDAHLWYQLTVKANLDEIRSVVAAAERLLPLDRLQTGPTADLGLGPDYEFDQSLGYVLQGLRDFPGEGWGLVSLGLGNRVTRNRNMAIRAIGAWPRDSWPPDAASLLNKAMWHEPDPKTRERIRTLLSGEADSYE
jgi:hypothetical protein